MTIENIKKSENHIVTVIKNPSKKMMDKVKQILEEKERRRKADLHNTHLYFPE